MEVLKNKNSILILLGNGFSFFGLGMNFIAISWLILEMTGNVLYVSILVALQSIPGFFIAPIAGVITDRYDKKKLAIISDVLRGLLILTIPIFHYFEILSLSYLYLVTLLTTIFGSVFFPSLSGIIKQSIPEELFLKTLSANAIATQMGMVLGGMVSGIIIASSSIFNIFYIDALTYFISGVCFLYISYTASARSDIANKEVDEIKSYYGEIKDGFFYVAKNRILIFLIFLGILPGIFTSIVNSLLGAYTKETLNLGPQAYGYLEASFAIGSIIVGFFIITIAKRKLSEYSLLTIGSILLSFSMLLLGLSQSLVLSLVSMFIGGGAIMLISPSRKSLLIKNVEGSYIGRVESLNFMMFSSVAPIITVIVGWSSKYIGYDSIFYLLTATFSIVTVVVFKKGRKYTQEKKIVPTV